MAGPLVLDGIEFETYGISAEADLCEDGEIAWRRQCPLNYVAVTLKHVGTVNDTLTVKKVGGKSING